jgi:hypothetical protein
MIGDVLFYLCAALIVGFGLAMGSKTPEQRKKDLEKHQ